jgi:hypothetical protein
MYKIDRELVIYSITLCTQIIVFKESRLTSSSSDCVFINPFRHQAAPRFFTCHATGVLVAG